MSTLFVTFSSISGSTTSAAVTSTRSTGSLSSTRPLSSSTQTSSFESIASDTSPLSTGARTGPSPTFTGADHPPYPTYGLSAGATVGIVVGVVIGACLLMCSIALFCWKRRQQRLKERKSSAKKDGGHRPISSRKDRRSRHNHSKQLSSHRPVTNNSNNTFPRNPNPEEIGVAVTSGQRQSLLQRLRSPKPKTRSILPISAPIPQRRVSVQTSFRDRFFAPPQSASEDDPYKHISDATTIQSSCNPPTPNDPTIAVLRPVSTSTSVATSFEEDREYQPDDIPPVPPLSAMIDLPTRSMAERRYQGGPSRLNVEAGIMKNINKATSHVPMTPKYDNGYGNLSTKSSLSIIPRSRLRSSRSADDPRSKNRGPQSSNPSLRSVALSKRSKLPPIPHSPPLPFAIPERDSSRRDANLSADEQWLLDDSTGESGSKAKTKILRPPPLVVRKKVSQPLVSPIRNLKYPRVPLSASENDLSRGLAGPVSPLTPNSTSRSNLNTDRYATKPLPPINHPSDLMEDLESGGYVTREPRTPSRITTIPSSSQGRLQIYASPSSSSTLAPSRAILTPNRTTSGDLVLTVNM